SARQSDGRDTLLRRPFAQHVRGLRALPRDAPAMSVMIVTGASSGIGRALTLRAARAGYDIVAIGRNREALAALEERVRAEHARIVVDAIDVSDPANAARIVVLAHRTFGRI